MELHLASHFKTFYIAEIFKLKKYQLFTDYFQCMAKYTHCRHHDHIVVRCVVMLSDVWSCCHVCNKTALRTVVLCIMCCTNRLHTNYSNQCSMTGVTKAVVCIIMSVG